MVFHGGTPGVDRSGLGRSSGSIASALAVRPLGEGSGSQMRGCFHVFSSGTDVTGVAVRQSTAFGRCVSSADTSLSLSLSLCPSSTPDLTAEFGRFAAPLAGFGKALAHAHCSKLPCHALGDVRRPHEVTRDRNSAYTHAKVRQAHCERTSRAPGGVAGSPRARHISTIRKCATGARRITGKNGRFSSPLAGRGA